MKYFAFNLIILFSLCLRSSGVYGQDPAIKQDSGKIITVHIIHGSKALKEYRKTEIPLLGGMRGGHVVNQVGDSVYGFQFSRWELHIFPRRKKEKKIGIIQKEGVEDWKKQFNEAKITSIEIPVSDTQFREVLREYAQYKDNVPYDYAFFGMRCAASCYEVLSDAGVLSGKRHGKIIARFFYPRPLRKHLQKLAKKNNYRITTTEGTIRRKWEKNYR